MFKANGYVCEERTYKMNAVRHFRSGCTLKESGSWLDAQYMLHLAAECYIKAYLAKQNKLSQKLGKQHSLTILAAAVGDGVFSARTLLDIKSIAELHYDAAYADEHDTDSPDKRDEAKRCYNIVCSIFSQLACAEAEEGGQGNGCEVEDSES